ncbi:alpha/beta hydrolase [Sphingobium sp. KCTC 72723]|uniref:alpha/beta hydrolase n=1 Tax=Sphingobium sp. KCTC 72723 TaxID=2733867 RepID=UPI00165D6084|nr:alpha/beta hydrolase [Sphingobium sp. KCTC 72723]
MYSHRKLYGHFAKAVGCDALIVDYRRAPENSHPGPVEDAVAAYHWLLDRAFDRSCIAFVGDSAGRALVLSGMLSARDRNMPLPAAGMAMAPYLDTEAKGESYTSNAQRDRLGSRDATLQFIALLLGPDGDRHDPTANPLHADLTGLPPILIQVGGDDVLLDDSHALATKARAVGIETTLEIYPDEQHVFQFMAGEAPTADAAIERASHWLRRMLDLS